MGVNKQKRKKNLKKSDLEYFNIFLANSFKFLFNSRRLLSQCHLCMVSWSFESSVKAQN